MITPSTSSISPPTQCQTTKHGRIHRQSHRTDRISIEKRLFDWGQSLVDSYTPSEVEECEWISPSRLGSNPNCILQ